MLHTGTESLHSNCFSETIQSRKNSTDMSCLVQLCKPVYITAGTKFSQELSLEQQNVL